MFVYLSTAGHSASAFPILSPDIPPIRIVLLSVFQPIRPPDQDLLYQKTDSGVLIYHSFSKEARYTLTPAGGWLLSLNFTFSFNLICYSQQQIFGKRVLSIFLEELS